MSEGGESPISSPIAPGVREVDVRFRVPPDRRANSQRSCDLRPPLVGGARRAGRLVILSVFVLVSVGYRDLHKTDGPEPGGILGNRYLASLVSQMIRQGGFGPDAEQVSSWGDILDFHLATSIGECIIRSFHGNDHGAHFRVNVTKNVRDTGAIEVHVSGSACLI